MADDVVVNPSASYTVAADDVGGIHYQRVKLDVGADGVTSAVNATNPLPVSGSVTIQQGASVSAAVSGTVTVAGSVAMSGTGLVSVVPGVSVTIQQGASVSAQVSGTVTVNGSVAVVPGVSVVAQVSGTATVNGTVTALLPGSTTGSSGMSGVLVWLGASQTVLISTQVSGTVTLSGTGLVSVVPGVSVTVQAGVSVTVVTQLGTQVVSVVPGLSVSAVVSGTVTVVNASVLSPTTAAPSISATGIVVWIGGGQSSTAIPVVITGTVTAGAGTTVVSGTVTVNGAVLVSGASYTAGSPTAISTGLIVWDLPAYSTTATPAAGATGAMVWVVNPGAAVATTVITIQTILGTAVVSVVPGVSVTIQQGASVSMPALAGVVASSVPATSVALGVPVWIVGGQTATGFPVQVSISVSAVLGTIVAVSGVTAVSAVSTIVTILGTQVVTIAQTSVSVAAVPTVNTIVAVSGVTAVSVLSTIVTILGTAIVSVVPGVSVLAQMSGGLFTIGTPTQASTAQIVVAKEQALQYVQIAVVSTAIAVSANKYAFTIWTGLTGAPAAAGTTSWAVPAGKVLRLSALQAAITSSAVLGGSVQLFVGVGATASMISASIPTQLQVLKLVLFGDAALRSEALIGHQADIAAGESIAVFIIASTAAVLRDFVIGGNLF